ncbi:hypothetical protein WG898_11655 [Paucibacter sp. AS307]|uniref:hypothetical protein n=1 Tax=Paucibacter soli TaxID=3133433 RepID=UPI0030B37890
MHCPRASGGKLRPGRINKRGADYPRTLWIQGPSLRCSARANTLPASRAGCPSSLGLRLGKQPGPGLDEKSMPRC